MGNLTRRREEERKREQVWLNRCFSQNKNSELKKKWEDSAPIKVPTGMDFEPINEPHNFKSKIKTKDKTARTLEFVKYLYGKYSVPKFMNKAWNDSSLSTITNIPRFGNVNENVVVETLYPFKKWWVCLALGKSLYKEYCKGILSKKEVHTFVNCPHNLSMQEAIVYSVAICSGAEHGNAIRIAKSKLKNMHLVNQMNTRNIIKYFVNHEAESVHQMNDLIDYIVNRYNHDNNFDINGRGYTLESLIKRMQDWHRELGRARKMGNHHWEGHPLDDYVFTPSDNERKYYGDKYKWTITQIKNSKELAHEGNVMHHCVSSYVGDCKRGTSSIWSMKSYDQYGAYKRNLTIEVDNYGAIVQVRGFGNRLPRDIENEILKMWADLNALVYHKKMNYW